MRLKVTVFQGRRHFAWRPVPLEDGRRAWLRFVYRLEPVGGIRPTFRGHPVVFTDRLPYGDPSLRGWLRHRLLGRAWRMRWRLLGYGLIGLAVTLTVTGPGGSASTSRTLNCNPKKCVE